MMHRPSGYKPFTVVFTVYALTLVLLDGVSNSWSIPTVAIVPLILIGQVLLVLTAPRKHLRALSTLLLILSLLAAPVLYFALSLAIEGFGSPVLGPAQRLALMSYLLVPLFGITQFVFFKIRKSF
jgi:hypothetical protein